MVIDPSGFRLDTRQTRAESQIRLMAIGQDDRGWIT
jgi:hypothetical protein